MVNEILDGMRHNLNVTVRCDSMTFAVFHQTKTCLCAVHCYRYSYCYILRMSAHVWVWVCYIETFLLVQVPQFILDDAMRKQKRVNIIVAQPRRIGAQSLAQRVCSERGWEIGTVVGYKVCISHFVQDEASSVLTSSRSSAIRSLWTMNTAAMIRACSTAPPAFCSRNWSKTNHSHRSRT